MNTHSTRGHTHTAPGTRLQRVAGRHRTLATAAVLVLAATTLPARAGDLTPPAGPITSTMKSLDTVEPRVPIRASDLPLTISAPGSYYLAENINAAGNGISITQNHVTIDLAGHMLLGGTGDAIEASATIENVTVRNGTIAGWTGNGVDLVLASNVLVADLVVSDNTGTGLRLGDTTVVRNCTARQNGAGIFTSIGSTVVDCTANWNTGDGFVVGGVISRCTAYANGDDGIVTSTGTLVKDCTARQNSGHGFSLSSGCSIEGSVAHSNGKDGIRFISHCRVVGNTAVNNGTTGTFAGIHADVGTGGGNTIDSNHATGNDIGFDVDSTCNLIIRNFALDNTTEYSIAGQNIAGAISTNSVSAGTDPNTNWSCVIIP